MKRATFLSLMAVFGLLGAGPARAYSVTVPVAQWVPTPKTNALVGVGSRQFMPYMTSDPSRTWALSVPKTGTMRFEVRHGDVNSYDYSVDGMQRERSEIGTVQRFPAGVPVHIAYDFMVEPGAHVLSWWGTAVGQMHEDGVGTSPPLALIIGQDDRFYIDHRHTGDPDRHVPLMTLVRGKTYKIDLYFLGGDKGHLTMLIDGKQVYDFAGGVGLSKGDFYWKLGVYRHASDATMAANYGNLHISTGDAVTMGKAEALPAPILRVNRASFITDIAGNLVPVGAAVEVYENGRKIADSRGTAWRSFNVKVALAPGIHYITARYAGSRITNETVLAFGKPTDVLAQFDLLTHAEGLAAIVLSDTHDFVMPATTNFPQFISQNQRALNAITTTYDYLIYAASWTRADYYDQSGKKVRSEKVRPGI